MANKLINMAIQTTTWALGLLKLGSSAEARAYLEVGGGSGGGSVDSVNGKSGTVVLNAADVGAATAAQGAKADTALQPGDAPGNITSVNGKTGVVVLAASDVGAVPTGSLATVATSGAYSDLTGKPTVATHTQGALASRPSTSTLYSTYYATDVRETYRWQDSAWQLVSGGGVVLASVAIENSGLSYANEIPVTNHDFGDFKYIDGAPSLLFTCGERPFVVTLSGTMRNGDANQTFAVQLEVNGTVYTQLLDMDTLASNWKPVVRTTKPLTFAAGTLITCRLRAVVGGSTNAALFTNAADPLQIVAMSV